MGSAVSANPLRLNEYHLHFLVVMIKPVKIDRGEQATNEEKKEMLRRIVEDAQEDKSEFEVANLIKAQDAVMIEWLATVIPVSWLDSLIKEDDGKTEVSTCTLKIYAFMTIVK